MTYKQFKKLAGLYDDFCSITYTKSYYTEQEIISMRKDFIASMTDNDKELYIDVLEEIIKDSRPAELYGEYDFGTEKEILSLINRIREA